MSDSSDQPESFPLLYAGDTGITLSRNHRLVGVDLVRSNGAPTLAGCYLANMLHAATGFSAEEQIVESGRQLIPSAGAADLDSGALLGTSSNPLLRLPLKTVLSDAPASSLRIHGVDFSVPGPVPPNSMGADPLSPPQCLDPFVRHLRDETAPTREEFGASSAPPVDHNPSPALLERLSTDQRTSFLQVWNRLPSHMREIAFDLRGLGWTPTVITQSGDALAEFSDVFSKSPAVLPFKVTVPPNTSPVTSRPYRINPPTAKQVDAVLDKFLTPASPSTPHLPGRASGSHPDEIRWHLHHGE